jgi:hypothetical protein
MGVITILQKQGNSGSVYDLASEHYDIEIDLGDRYNFAVVLPSFYGVKPTRHVTLERANRKALALSNLGYKCVTVMDSDGRIIRW